MPPFLSALASGPADALARHGIARIAPVAMFHLAALALMIWCESGAVQMVAFILSWAFVNAVWLVLLRKPGLSAALSFALLVVLIVASRFKFGVVGMGLSFIDVMIVNADTISYLWQMFPKVRTGTLAILLIALPLAVLLWKVDPFCIRRRV